MNYKTRLYAGITAIAVIVFGGILSVCESGLGKHAPT